MVILILLIILLIMAAFSAYLCGSLRHQFKLTLSYVLRKLEEVESK